jgi:hypothetical protein
MNGKPIMNDLRTAILAVLQNAMLSSDGKIPYMEVKESLLKTLQAEYNIYFVEPDEKQVEII